MYVLSAYNVKKIRRHIYGTTAHNLLHAFRPLNVETTLVVANTKVVLPETEVVEIVGLPQ
jgi:hypothetical protein